MRAAADDGFDRVAHVVGPRGVEPAGESELDEICAGMLRDVHVVKRV